VAPSRRKHGPVTDRKRPLEQAIELAVFAPLGFALEARKLLPSFVDRGRAQVQMTKMIGQFAVKQGQSEAEKRLVKAQKQADSVLAELGLRGGDAPSTAATPSAAPTAPTPASATSARSATPVTQSGAGADELAITDYDSLAASQVIPRLESLTADELAAVARYETAHRARKTILGKISQIQAG
jgi:hypothetical protein